MPRLSLILSLVAFVLFNYAQYLGWNLFAENADAQPARSAGTARVWHK